MVGETLMSNSVLQLIDEAVRDAQQLGIVPPSVVHDALWAAAREIKRLGEADRKLAAAYHELENLHDIDAAALEIRRWRELLRALVASLPHCDACDSPATKANGRGGPRWCDVHAPGDTPDYPRAKPLREAVQFLERARGAL
jgi:hypothetical protein